MHREHLSTGQAIRSHESPETRIPLENQTVRTLLEGEAFCTRLAKAARITNRTGHEAGFGYYYDRLTDTAYASPVFEGGCDELPYGLFVDWRDRVIPDSILTPGHFIMLLHTHPQCDEPLLLSHEDVNLTSELQARPLVCVAGVDRQRVGDIICMQSLYATDLYIYKSAALDHLAESFCERAEQGRDTVECTALLEEGGLLRADALRYRVERGSKAATLLNPVVLDRYALRDALGPPAGRS